LTQPRGQRGGRRAVWAWRIGIRVVLLGAGEPPAGIKAVSRTTRLHWIDPIFVIQSPGTPKAADMMVARVVLAAIGFVMAPGIRQTETRLLRWRPEYQKR
jgi:hypothetical protein